MLFTTIIACLSFSSHAAGAALLRSRQEPEVQSAPFNLILTSSNETLDGSQLSAGHSGAAIEELLIGNQTIRQTVATVFTFNETVPARDNTPATGNLIWVLPAANLNVSSPLAFSYDPFYDSAIPKFTPSDIGTPLSFTAADELVYYHYATSEPVAVDRWYACQLSAERNAGYEYFAVVWALGSREPSDATCQKVSIKRVFV